jgi:Type II secretion system protein C
VPVTPVQRALLILVLLLLAAIVASSLWPRRRPRPTAPIPAPAPPATPTRAPPRAATAAPVGYRLAGVVVGDTESLAVIEAPNGTDALYRAGDEVPGLGRLLRIDAERVVVAGKSGTLQLWLAPAATATPVRAVPAAASPAAPAVTRPTVRTPPRRHPTAAGTARESAP